MMCRLYTVVGLIVLVTDTVRGATHRKEFRTTSERKAEFEFGRIALRDLLEDDLDLERSLQDMLDVDILAASMSFSMGVTPGGRRATASPQPAPISVTDPPSAVSLAERLIPCTGTTTIPISMTIEVDLTTEADATTNFSKDLQKALTTGISSIDDNYEMCDPRRRSLAHPAIVPHHEQRRQQQQRQQQHERRLQDGVYLSPIIITETGQSCIPQDITARSCRVATADFQAFGTDDSRSVVTSVDSIVKHDATFKSDLQSKGIVGVRVVDDEGTNSDREVNFDSPNSSTSTSQNSNGNSSRTILAIVFSVAAVVLLVAVILRRGSRRRRHLWYGPTMEEIYGEDQCLGIQPRESFEDVPDDDSYHVSKPEHPNAASF